MKEILFRGKIRESGNWVEGWYCGQTNKSFFGEPVNRPQIIVKDDLGWAEVIPETVGQYTGRQDKHKTKVFEGDLVYACSQDVNKDDGIGIIEWNEIELCYIVSFKKFSYMLCDVTSIEVIGNIYDNPEYCNSIYSHDIIESGMI